MTRRFSVPLRFPEDVVSHLAQGERHWRDGYSAKELAYAWATANGFPRSVRIVLDACPDYRGAELIDGFFEREVDLRSAGEPTHTDLMLVVAMRDQLAVIAVEGKVEEPFGEIVTEWLKKGGRREPRLRGLCAALGIEMDAAMPLRYQLLHRTAAAVFEAQRYRVRQAMMLVHSFSGKDSSFADFQAFASVLDIPVNAVGEVSGPRTCEGLRLRLGWVADRPRALASPVTAAAAT